MLFRLFPAIFFVKVCVRGLHIGSGPKDTNAEAKSADEEPTDKAEIEKEKFHLVTVHNAAAFVNALLPCVGRVIVLNVKRHGIAV